MATVDRDTAETCWGPRPAQAVPTQKVLSTEASTPTPHSHEGKKLANRPRAATEESDARELQLPTRASPRLCGNVFMVNQFD